MSRRNLHRLFVALVVLFVVGAALLYLLSIVLAPEGGDVARHFDQFAILAFLGAVLFGIIDFFVRSAMPRTPDESRDAHTPLNH